MRLLEDCPMTCPNCQATRPKDCPMLRWSWCEVLDAGTAAKPLEEETSLDRLNRDMEVESRGVFRWFEAAKRLDEKIGGGASER